MSNLQNIIYISNEDFETLVTNGSVTIGGVTHIYDSNNVYITPDDSVKKSEMYKPNLFYMNKVVSGFTSLTRSSYKINANKGVAWFTIQTLVLPKGTYSVELRCLESVPYTRIQVAGSSSTDTDILCGNNANGGPVTFIVSDDSKQIYIKICTDKNYSSYGAVDHTFQIMLNESSQIAPYIEHFDDVPTFTSSNQNYVLSVDSGGNLVWLAPYDGYYTT